MKKFEVFGKHHQGECKPGEGKCITYPVIREVYFAYSAEDAEDAFVDDHPECDEILTHETCEIDMTVEELAEYGR